jgi:hypothetical protein
MIKATILATTIWLTPTAKTGGDLGTFGFKYTQKLSDNIYFKVRVEEKSNIKEDPQAKAKVYFDFNF